SEKLGIFDAQFALGGIIAGKTGVAAQLFAKALQVRGPEPVAAREGERIVPGRKAPRCLDYLTEGLGLQIRRKLLVVPGDGGKGRKEIDVGLIILWSEFQGLEV